MQRMLSLWPYDPETWFLVCYATEAGSRLRRRLLEVFGERYERGLVQSGLGLAPLPFELGPFAAAEARAIQRRLDGTGDLAAPGDCFLWQRAPELVRELQTEEASALALHALRDEADEPWRVVGTCALRRCWVLLLERPEPLREQAAVLVDRGSRQALLREPAQVDEALRRRGLSQSLGRAL